MIDNGAETKPTNGQHGTGDMIDSTNAIEAMTDRGRGGFNWAVGDNGGTCGREGGVGGGVEVKEWWLYTGLLFDGCIVCAIIRLPLTRYSKKKVLRIVEDAQD